MGDSLQAVTVANLDSKGDWVIYSEKNGALPPAKERTEVIDDCLDSWGDAQKLTAYTAMVRVKMGQLEGRCTWVKDAD